MEIAEPCCGVRYNCCSVEEEEELTITPHHTPSQSFDFIVLEKAYLDSIPAAAASTSINICSSISKTTKEVALPLHGNFAKGSTIIGPHMCNNTSSSHILHPCTANYLGASLSVDHGPSRDDHLKLFRDKEIWVPIVQSTSSQNHSTLMSCRTDADLPSCFFDYKPRISDGGLTSLEEAVRRYAARHPQVVAPSPIHRSKERRITCTTSDKLKQQLNVNHEALLRRSFSQPGGGSCKGLFRPSDSHAAVGFNKPTSKNNLGGREVFGHPGIYRDQCNGIYRDQCNAGPAPAPAQNRAKMSCFPTSPGRRKHGQSTPDDQGSTQFTWNFKKPSVDSHLQQDKFMSPACNPTLNIHLQQQNRLPTPVQDVTDYRNSDYRNSFSDMSSNYDHDAAAALNMSKVKLWGLHHRFKTLCKKLCSTF